jgi:hypothetical protein
MGEEIMYIVKRNGGNVNHRWRTVLTTKDRKAAEKRFDRELEKMRQGGLVLLETSENKETVLRQKVAPRVRTRW